MIPTKITGASQHTEKNQRDEWRAWYTCHRCGEEFAQSREFCRNETESCEESQTAFDLQQRRYCYRCGYKLTTLDDIPDDTQIAALNATIDDLQAKLKYKPRSKMSVTENAWAQYSVIVEKHRANGFKNEDIENLLLMVVALSDELSAAREAERDEKD